VLISVFSVMGVIGLFVLVGWIIKCCCCGGDDRVDESNVTMMRLNTQNGD
jgi:hypothetical protein